MAWAGARSSLHMTGALWTDEWTNEVVLGTRTQAVERWRKN